MVEPRREEVHHGLESSLPHRHEDLVGQSPFRLQDHVRATELIRKNVDLAGDLPGCQGDVLVTPTQEMFGSERQGPRACPRPPNCLLT